MNELRYRGGLTAEAAIDVASGGKITVNKDSYSDYVFICMVDMTWKLLCYQHKKHSFTAPEEYFGKLIY